MATSDYKRNPDWNVKKGETLGGTSDYPKTFKSKLDLDCYTDKKGMNIYVKKGETPGNGSTKIYGSAESAHKALTEQKLRKEPTGLERNEKKPLPEGTIDVEKDQMDESFSAFLRSKFTKY